MRIASRITLTISLVVMVALGAFGLVRLRSDTRTQKTTFTREAVQLGTMLRATLDATGGIPADRVARGASLTRELARSGSAWRVTILDAAAPPPDGDLHAERLRRVLQLKTPLIDEQVHEGDRDLFVYLEPVRAPAPTPDGYVIVGAIELARPLTAADDLALDILLPLGVIALILIIAVYGSVRRGLGRPVARLIGGIDGVARGDLSEVVLSEREDELGALASRFNDMTASLREAREETLRAAEGRAQIERHLRASERLATVGSIAAEIAHEVGTPLNVVTGRARAMARKADDPEAVQKNATIIAEQATRITRIIQRLLDFARRRVGEADAAQPIDLAELAGEVVEFLEHQLDAARVKASLVIDRTVGPVAGKRDALQQVLLNLCVNAIQAMPAGGTLRLSLSRVVRRRPGLELAPEQPYAVLEVADTGSGISAEDREKIFEPFYTSRAEGGGSGLGLTVSLGIVKEHDGWIEVDENHAGGRGALFRVMLPLA
jgi:signal transduction histidine kinase